MNMTESSLSFLLWMKHMLVSPLGVYINSHLSSTIGLGATRFLLG